MLHSASPWTKAFHVVVYDERPFVNGAGGAGEVCVGLALWPRRPQVWPPPRLVKP